jgi:hypothetical protein
MGHVVRHDRHHDQLGDILADAAGHDRFLDLALDFRAVGAVLLLLPLLFGFLLALRLLTGFLVLAGLLGGGGPIALGLGIGLGLTGAFVCGIDLCLSRPVLFLGSPLRHFLGFAAGGIGRLLPLALDPRGVCQPALLGFHLFALSSLPGLLLLGALLRFAGVVLQATLRSRDTPMASKAAKPSVILTCSGLSPCPFSSVSRQARLADSLR